MAMMFAVCLIAAALASPGIAADAIVSPAPDLTGGCTDTTDTVTEFSITVDGQSAHGRYALPSSTAKSQLVIFAHGYSHTTESWVPHLLAAATHGAVAVAMDYRGLNITFNDPGLDTSRGWNALTGAEDLVAAARYFQDACGSSTVGLLGVSMGGNMSGLALAAGARRITGNDVPLFDYWVDVEGAVNIIETYFAARGAGDANEFAGFARDDIVAETGGTFEETPQEYHKRAVVEHVDEIKASGVKAVAVVHSLEDGLVPYNQAREIATLLLQHQIPTRLYTIGSKDAASDNDTTLSGDVLTNLDGSYISPLSGHASEKSTVHIVMKTGFAALWDLMDYGPGTCYSENIVDGASDLSVGAPSVCI